MLIEMMWVFFKIGLFTIGGGYAMIPLITEELTGHGWMSMAEIADIIAIAKMTPGPFAVNAATFSGMKIFGIGGALACTLGVILPSLIITLIVAKFFFQFQDLKVVNAFLKGIRPTVVALIASAVVTVSLITLFKIEDINQIISGFQNLELFSIVILIISLTLLLWKKLHPIIVICIAGVAGVLFYQVLPLVI